jgi:hypothetical protein
MFVNQELEGLARNRERALLRRLFNARPMPQSQCLTSAGLRIKGGSASAVKCRLTPSSTQLPKACSSPRRLDTDMAALAGTVTNAQVQRLLSLRGLGGHADHVDGASGATLGGVVFPPTTDGLAMIGFTSSTPLAPATSSAAPLRWTTPPLFPTPPS